MHAGRWASDGKIVCFSGETDNFVIQALDTVTLSDHRAAYTLARTAGKAGRFQAGKSLRAERSMTTLPLGVDWALERGFRGDGQEGL